MNLSLTAGLAARPAGADHFGAGELRSLAEAGRRAQWVQLVNQIAHGWARGQARGSVALAALDRDEQFLQRTQLPLFLRRPLHEFARLAGGRSNRADVAVALDRQGDRRTARLK